MKLIRRVLSATIAIGFVFPASAPAHADVLPPKGSVSIDSVTITGNRCRWPYDPKVELKPDATGFDITYKGFRAAIGPPTAPPEDRRDCRILLKLQSPQGYTLAIRRFEQGGTADIADGASAQHGTAFLYSGAVTLVNHPFVGPYRGAWQRSFDVPEVVYLPCGEPQTLTVTDELRVLRGNSPQHKNSSLTLGFDGLPLRAATNGPPPVARISKYFLSWKRC